MPSIKSPHRCENGGAIILIFYNVLSEIFLGGIITADYYVETRSETAAYAYTLQAVILCILVIVGCDAGNTRESGRSKFACLGIEDKLDGIVTGKVILEVSCARIRQSYPCR